MRVPREKVSVALFQLFQQSQQLQQLCRTITRKVKLWTQVDDAQVPWLMLFKGGPNTENYSQTQASGLTKYVLHYNLWLYLRSDPTDVTIAETAINNIADGIDAAFQQGVNRTSFGERQTLGGLVTNAWIEGGSEWAREFDDNNIVIMWLILVDTGI